MAKFYGVRFGRNPGIYRTWEECKKEVDGFTGAEYKSFKTLEEAEDYVGFQDISADAETGGSSRGNGKAVVEEDYDSTSSVKMRAFIDGSYDNSKKIYSYGSVITWKNQKIKLFGADNDSRFVDFRNVAGEIIAATRTLQFAVENGVSEIEIFYDYAGIEKWAKREWKRNNALTQGYAEYVRSIEGDISIRFVKVKAHSGHRENDEVDQLAKDALKSRKKHNMEVG